MTIQISIFRIPFSKAQESHLLRIKLSIILASWQFIFDFFSDVPAIKSVVSCKSNRYLVEEENVFQSDINVSESMKKFVGKKLSSIIEQTITFVELNDKNSRKSIQNSSNTYGVKLLRDSGAYLQMKDAIETECSLPKISNIKPIRKRTLEVDVSSEKEKLMKAAIEPCSVRDSTKCWTSRPKAVVYEYKTVGSISVLQEPVNEFTSMKRKKAWNDSKIMKFRKKC